MNYRWLLDGVPDGYQWLNGEGLHAHDVTDAADFRLTTHAAPPSWAQDAVLYQIFPDRFAKSVDRPVPAWAVPQRWDDPVIGNGPETPYQLYGGDLDGITAHLDHIASTGANTVYLTPVFPARSNHRYDASTFDVVDPQLGGDAALARLSDALHARGMRLLGDLTTKPLRRGPRMVSDCCRRRDDTRGGLLHLHRPPPRIRLLVRLLVATQVRSPRSEATPPSVRRPRFGCRTLAGPAWAGRLAHRRRQYDSTDGNDRSEPHGRHDHSSDDGRRQPGVAAAG